jgi:hypothetical protein
VPSARATTVLGRRTRALGLAILAGVVTLVLATAVVAGGAGASGLSADATVQKPKPKPKPTPPKTLSGTGIIRWGETYRAASGYERYRYVLVSRHMADAAARLPGKTLAYMNATTIYRYWSTGVSYEEAVAGNWLLKDANGAHLRNAKYDGWLGDLGDRAYQDRFVANVADFIKRTKINGVFIDDLRASPLGFDYRFPAKYPNQQAWEQAAMSFVSYVGPALRKLGHYVMVNAAAYIENDWASNTGEHYARFFKQVAPHVDGIMMEYWMQNPVDIARLRSLGSSWYEYYDGWQSLVSITQAAGAEFFGLMYGSGGDTRAMRYGRAAFLLDWNGKGGAFMWAPVDRNDPYHAVAVRQLGQPSAAKFQRGPGVWQRRYEHGIVVLNANTTPVTVRVGGGLVSLAPTDAVFARHPKKP